MTPHPDRPYRTVETRKQHTLHTLDPQPTRRGFLGSAGRLALAAMPGAAWIASRPAWAGDWPDRPIRWVVPYLPGTAPDSTVRLIAESMSALLKQTIVIDNRAGAGGNLGAQQVAHARPDGYTWLYSGSPLAGNTRLYKSVGFDAMKDFTHVTRLSDSDVALVVSADSLYRNVAGLVAALKAAPGRLNYASGGIGTPAHLAAALFLARAGADAIHIPYKGATEALQAVTTNQVAFSVPLVQAALGQVAGGRLRALAVASASRNPHLPQVPTFAEAGFPGLTYTSFGGISLPRGAPDTVVARINAVARQALADPVLHAKLLGLGGVPVTSTSAQYAQAMQEELARTDATMQAAHLMPQ